MAYNLSVASAADRDLDKILTYIIEELKNPPAAVKLMDDIALRYDKLMENPFLYSECHASSLRMAGYRKVAIGSYIMIHRVDTGKEIVYVERFFSGLQNYEKLI